MIDIDDCQKFISKASSIIQEAKFCSSPKDYQEYGEEINEHLDTALKALVYASELVNEQLNFTTGELQYDNRFIK